MVSTWFSLHFCAGARCANGEQPSANACARAGPPAAVPPGVREAGGLRGDAAGDGDGGDGAVPRRGAAEGPRAGAAGLRRHTRRRRRRLHPAFRRRCHEVLGLAC
jgi:hypothetical protein